MEAKQWICPAVENERQGNELLRKENLEMHHWLNQADRFLAGNWRIDGGENFWGIEVVRLSQPQSEWWIRAYLEDQDHFYLTYRENGFVRVLI